MSYVWRAYVCPCDLAEESGSPRADGAEPQIAQMHIQLMWRCVRVSFVVAVHTRYAFGCFPSGCLHEARVCATTEEERLLPVLLAALPDWD